MNGNALEEAPKGLNTLRLQRLVDRLERDPDVELTIGAWRPQCPMVLAGFTPDSAANDTPEPSFAGAWDRFAQPERRWGVRLTRSGHKARRSDVQLLLRMANAVLARRAPEAAAHQHSAVAPAWRAQ